MCRVENELFAKRVIHYYKNQANFCKKILFITLLARGEAEKLYNILDRFSRSSDENYKPIPGRPPTTTSPGKQVKVEKVFKKSPNLSVREAARNLHISKSAVSRIKVQKLGISAKTMKKSSQYVKDQEPRTKTRLRKIYKKTRKKVLIIDDETYVPINPSELPGRKFYHDVGPENLKYEHIHKGKSKFPEKFLIWQALDEMGNVSEAYISKDTMTAQIYLEECIKKRLIPFILKYHEIDEILFWPDLASSHYAKIVTKYLNEKNVEFVSKEENPPNVPQARGIELFWAECKRRYSCRSEKPKNLQGFKLVWGHISKQTAKDLGKSLMDHSYKILRQIGYKGLREAMKDINCS